MRSRKRTHLDEFNERYNTSNKTNKEVLKEQQKNWTAACYSHFESPTIIVEGGRDGRYRFKCKRSAAYVTRARHDNSTGNLGRHIDGCKPGTVTRESAISSFAHGSTYSEAKFRFLIARWMYESHRPFAIIDDLPFQEMLRMLFAKVWIPSAMTTSCNIRDIFKVAKQHVVVMIQRYPGHIHIGFDGWTSPNTFSFLGLVIYYLDSKSNLVSHILDFIKLNWEHRGQYIAEELNHCLEEFGIGQMLLGQATDNASNNNTALEELATLLPNEALASSATHIRCICHILNLVTKAILSQFTQATQRAGWDNVACNRQLLHENYL